MDGEEKFFNRNEVIAKMFTLAKGDVSKTVLAARCAIKAFRETGCTEIIYIALTILAKLKIYDRDLVGKLLDVLFTTKGNFLCIFSHTVFKIAPNLTYGIVDDKETSEYFLTVMSNRCYEVHENIVRFVDVPVFGLTLAAISAFMGANASVLLFLRHGADPFKVQRILDSPYEVRQTELIRFVARATPYPDKNLRKFLELPQPPTLKHLCKFAIRYRLLINDLLPIGISALPLFPRLQNYLDLLED